MRKNKALVAFFGAVFFGATIAFVVMTAVLVFDRVEELGGDEWNVAVVMILVIVFLSLACTIIDWVRRKIMVDRPVSKILTATEKISKGDFTHRTEPLHPYGKYDEYDVIMENLNVMAAELEKSEMMKNDFISNVSHELKTPLAIISNYAQLLGDDALTSEERAHYAQTVCMATSRLNELIMNILKLNKLENSEIHPEKERISLTSLLSESILTFEDGIEKRGIVLDCDLDDVYINSSAGYLELIWNNLLSNAVKFTDEGGDIFVSLKRDGDSAIVRVRDTGCGISAEVGAHIFEKFYQGDTSHKGEGNGLGLALVKKVIDLLGGEISVHSKEGVGTEFTVILKDVEDEG